MKLINITLVFLSLLTLGLLNLEAKSIEFVLSQTTQGTINLEAEIPKQVQEQPYDSPSILSYCRQLKIENFGNEPVKNCFPYINQSPSLSLKKLALKLAKEECPILALYQLWNRSVVRVDSKKRDKKIHPLDLLNFKGSCSASDFNQQFIKLCHAIGIEIRQSNVRGKQFYDFQIDEEWNCLDLSNHQYYLGLNNDRLASSEDVVDDPFLALRTKHGRQAKFVDFKEAWKQVAAFDILETSSVMPMVLEEESLPKRAKGFDLYPGEFLMFETPDVCPELAPYERSIDHRINLVARDVTHRWKYFSPFPIRRIVNNSDVSVRLLHQKVTLEPGESFAFTEDNLFLLRLAFKDVPRGYISISGTCSWTLFPALEKGKNQIHLGAEKNRSLVRFSFEVNEDLEKSTMAPIQVLNSSHVFHYCAPYFELQSQSEQGDRIWWQIGLDEQFKMVPPNFDQVEPFTSVVALPLISETFLNRENTYYFRVKEFTNGRWGDWSKTYRFRVVKPHAAEQIEFEQIDKNEYELNWKRYADVSDDTIEYLVFGSNSLDFIPSIFCDKQVNAIVDGVVVDEEENDNLVAITTEAKIRVTGSLAYYRIIARQRGQLSIPSSLIHVYDQELIQPRNVLQYVEDEEHSVAKRLLIPATYPWTQTSLPQVLSSSHTENHVIKLQSLLRSVQKLTVNKYPYEFPDVSEEIWEQVRPYLLPENHPGWTKLNRVFCNQRVTQTPEQFKKAGFRRWRPGRWSRVAASSHPEFPEYFIKAYCDNELGILYDYRKWIHRINGAETIRKCIKDYHLGAKFKVPRKWLYPLPKRPSPPRSSHYLRKNFILVCENMRILPHKDNEKAYKHKMTRPLMEGLYTILQVCGLYDSVYVFNIPFCMDGKIAVIDTEYHHKWPVPYVKLTKAFSSSMQTHWRRITYKGGKIPDGIPQHNPPRMDRRDIPRL